MHNGNYKMISDLCNSTKEISKVSLVYTFSSTKTFMMMLSVAIIAMLVSVSHVEGTFFTLTVTQVPVLSTEV